MVKEIKSESTWFEPHNCMWCDKPNDYGHLTAIQVNIDFAGRPLKVWIRVCDGCYPIAIKELKAIWPKTK